MSDAPTIIQAVRAGDVPLVRRLLSVDPRLVARRTFRGGIW